MTHTICYAPPDQRKPRRPERLRKRWLILELLRKVTIVAMWAIRSINFNLFELGMVEVFLLLLGF